MDALRGSCVIPNPFKYSHHCFRVREWFPRWVSSWREYGNIGIALFPDLGVGYMCMSARIMIVHRAVTMISFYGLHGENKRNIYHKRKPCHLFNNYHQITSLVSQGAVEKKPGSIWEGLL